MSPCWSLTHLPSFKSIAGMINMINPIQPLSHEDTKLRNSFFLSAFVASLSGLLFSESLQYRQPQVLALLGMELDRENIVLPDARDELSPVSGRGCDHALVFGHYVVGVHEVEVAAVGHVGERGRPSFDGNGIPAQVRDLERWIVNVESYYAPLDDVQSLVDAELLALGEEKLQAQAYAQKRLARGDAFFHRVDEAELFEISHAARESAHAGEDNFTRAEDRLRVARDHGLASHALEAFLHAA